MTTTEPAVAVTLADRSAVWRGHARAAAHDIGAVAPGVVPFGVVLGVTASAAHSGALATMFGAVSVYGGSAQLATLTLLHLGAGILAAVLSGAVVNARVMLYGAALEPLFLGQPLWFRLVGVQFILDQTYLATSARDGFDRRGFRAYWLWLAGLLAMIWVAAVATGLALAPGLPPLPHLIVVGVALFVAMLAPRIVGRRELVVAVVSALTALVVARMVAPGAIVAGALAGIAAGLLLDRTAS